WYSLSAPLSSPQCSRMVPALKCAGAARLLSPMREKCDASERQSARSVLAFLAASHFLTAVSNSALLLAETLGFSACLAAACCSCCCCCLVCSICDDEGGLGAVSFLASGVVAAAASSSSPFDTGVPVCAQPTTAVASHAE